MPEHVRWSDDQLREVSDHLFYELWMLEGAVQVLRLPLLGRGVLANAVVESFAVHARALHDFFYRDRTKPDDVIASDYFDSPSDWVALRGEPADELAKAVARVNKEVAHLTFSRLSVLPEEKGWSVAEIASCLSSVAGSWRHSARPDWLGPSWLQNASGSER